MNVQYGASNWSHSMASMGYTNSGTYRRGFSLKHRVLHPSLTEQNPARFNWGFTHTFGTVWEKMVALPAAAAVTPVLVVPRRSRRRTAIDSTPVGDHAIILFVLWDGYRTRKVEYYFIIRKYWSAEDVGSNANIHRYVLLCCFVPLLFMLFFWVLFCSSGTKHQQNFVQTT